ncbi:MAG TPA: universal stress protein, partial [Dehalococcoidia bacterium]
EAIIPELEWMAGLPDAEFTFLSIAPSPHETLLGRSTLRVVSSAGPNSMPIGVPGAAPTLIEDRGQAVERVLTERSDYLKNIVSRMPQGPKYHVVAAIGDDVAAAIIRHAMEHAPDVIVMGTHGETHMIHRLFGDTAEAVVRAGVAPVLLVHPETTHRVARN